MRASFTEAAFHKPLDSSRGTTTLPECKPSKAGHEKPGTAHAKAKVAGALIAALSTECKAYCILSGYDRLPESFDTDIDFMVDRNDFNRIPRILEEVARASGTRLFQSVEHEPTARAFFLASLAGQEFTIVQPDSASDYRHFGTLWLRADEVLAARRWHSNGFWIPSAAHEFIYTLIKRLNKRSFSPEHGLKLHRLYLEDAMGCYRILTRFFSQRGKIALRRMAVANDWAELCARLETFRKDLMAHAAETPVQTLFSLPRRALHTLGRIRRPTGAWIAFIGPDGSGKSLAIRAVRQQFAPAFRDVECFHMRPKLFRRNAGTAGAVTDPHGQPSRGLLASVAKVFYLAADYTLGYAFRIAPALARTRLVLFDRYIYDLAVDCKRVRYGGPAWLIRLAVRLVPQPDLVIVLDAPAEVLWSRKQEVPFNEVVRQRQAYLELARKLPSAVVVNAAQPIPGLIHDVAAAVVDHLARRAAGRLKLPASTPAAAEAGPDAPGYRC
jgi:thymidylate kinase